MRLQQDVAIEKWKVSKLTMLAFTKITVNLYESHCLAFCVRGDWLARLDK